MEDLRKRLRFMPEKASFCTGELIRNASSRCVIISAHSRQKRLIIQLLPAEKGKKPCPEEQPVFHFLWRVARAYTLPAAFTPDYSREIYSPVLNIHPMYRSSPRAFLGTIRANFHRAWC
ncbi:hypothetical protein IE985_20590 [Klebsiella pneumoniae]|nr:hypothetical protein [Klebsiella pneumoniae]